MCPIFLIFFSFTEICCTEANGTEVQVDRVQHLFFCAVYNLILTI